ncbi:MAG TPA: DUF1775 domain-containing protein [Acidimicrobiales bacterium]|nr:DUF1775 domain-containing protein [Acidimicrobiales bacterium]
MIRRLFALPALVLLWLALLTGVASAHVDVEAEQALAGATTTLTFSFHHGKDGTATTGLEVLLPPGTTVVDVPAVEGWQSAVDEATGTVTWTGGPVPDGTEARLPVVVSLPTTPGEVLFKTIQTTEAGELAWIEEDDSEAEGRYPAPRLTLAPNPAASTTAPGETTTTTAEATITTQRRPGTTLEAEQRDDGNNDMAPWLIGSGIVALVAVAIGGYALKRRSDAAG